MPADGDKQQGVNAPDGLLDLRAMEVIQRHMLGAMGLGLIPFPALDAVAITALQVRMLRELARIYHLGSGNTQTIYAVIGSLTAGLGLPLALAPAILGAFKLVPGFGTTAGILTLPLAAGATTYALGKVFVQHFESGGTFLSFSPQQVRDKMRAAYEQGMLEATKLNQSPSEDPP